MQVFIRVKAVGRRKPIFELIEVTLPAQVSCLEEAIREIVAQQVSQYNARNIDQTIFPYLSQEQLEDQALAGRVSFGAAYDERKADKAKAITDALQAFEDGIYKVLIDDKVIDRLDERLELKDGAVFTFIRLTLLSGMMY